MAKNNTIITPRPPSFIREVFQQFRADECTLLAAAISFYALLSIIPLTFLGVAFLGHIMGSSEGAVEQVIAVITELLPLPVVDRLEDLLHSVVATRGVASILAPLLFQHQSSAGYRSSGSDLPVDSGTIGPCSYPADN